MKVQSGFTVHARIRTFWKFRFIFRIASDKKQLGNLILHKMIPAMFPDSVFMPENHFAPSIKNFIMLLQTCCILIYVVNKELTHRLCNDNAPNLLLHTLESRSLLRNQNVACNSVKKIQQNQISKTIYPIRAKSFCIDNGLKAANIPDPKIRKNGFRNPDLKTKQMLSYLPSIFRYTIPDDFT